MSLDDLFHSSDPGMGVIFTEEHQSFSQAGVRNNSSSLVAVVNRVVMLVLVRREAMVIISPTSQVLRSTAVYAGRCVSRCFP